MMILLQFLEYKVLFYFIFFKMGMCDIMQLAFML